jgi:NAD(P)-dependent dehydrogenase (short-subunit alcohol dehydrogenase family)
MGAAASRRGAPRRQRPSNARSRAGPNWSEGLERWPRPAAEARGVALEVVEKEFIAAMRPTSLIGRFGSTQKVANMVVYVCSEQASATTGAALRVDGGVVRFVA